MGMVRREVGSRVKVMVVISILFFAGTSLAANEDEDLLKQANQIFGVLPKAVVSEKNPITPEKVHLGKILFYETRISIDGTISCSKCHPISLYGADGLRKAIGNNCKTNPRNSPTIFNAAGQISEHWIGNRIDVEDQAKQSVIGPPSFGMPSYEVVEKRLKEIKGYINLFRKTFPKDDDPITIDNFAKAVGAFERTLITPSSFDTFLKGKKEALKEEEKRGLRTFIEVGCIMCHSGAYVGGQVYQNFGLIEPYWKYTKSQEIDEGRKTVTMNEKDQYVFKVPMLRNVAKTSPYFHDGSVDRLDAAEFIMGKVQLGRDLTRSQLEDTGSFLRSLTGNIPEDIFRIPLLPSME
ncbi:MAG: cytochrome c peroxidase [Thermodesulfobacteriota bacterium]